MLQNDILEFLSVSGMIASFNASFPDLCHGWYSIRALLGSKLGRGLAQHWERLGSTLGQYWMPSLGQARPNIRPILNSKLRISLSQDRANLESQAWAELEPMCKSSRGQAWITSLRQIGKQGWANLRPILVCCLGNDRRT